jgi:outer membrane lipoprotein-sorting protein
MSPLARVATTAAALLLAGCASSLPKYQWEGDQAAITELARRAQSIHAIRATATLVLISADNQHVTLDAAIVAENAPSTSAPNCLRLRIRTWKFGQAIFDLTAKPDGIWLAADTGGGPPTNQDRLRSLKPEQIAQAWNLFFGDYFSRPGLAVGLSHENRTLTVQRKGTDAKVRCIIDMDTLTPREYSIRDLDGHVHQTLTLSRYKLIDNTAWPMQVIARGDQGVIEVRFDDVEINPDLEDAVFTPPQRAVKQ